MSPLRWIQFTGSHWTVMLEEVTSDVVTDEGGADGAGKCLAQMAKPDINSRKQSHWKKQISSSYL